MIKIVAAFLRLSAGKTGRLVSETISSLSISAAMVQRNATAWRRQNLDAP